MKGKGRQFMSLGLVLVLTITAVLTLTTRIDAAAPEFVSVSFDSVENDIEMPVNISITFDVTDEEITKIEVQSCVGDICNMPETMTDSGDGETFYFEFPAGYFGTEPADPYFHFFVDYGASGSFIYPTNLSSHEINISLFKYPDFLIVNASADKDSIFPGQMVTITGDISNDLGEMVDGARIDLSVNGTDFSNSTLTDSGGLFEIGAMLHQEGSLTINLTVSSDDLLGYAEFPVSVSSWPMPNIAITGEVEAETMDSPPSSNLDTFYQGSNITLTYRVKNTGTGTAGNVTVSLSSTDGTFNETEEAGNISISERFEDQLYIPSNSEGQHQFMISAQWDQIAPFSENFTFPSWTYTYTIVPRPVWTGHSVLVEMFTQTTCGPCVDVEESIEILYREENDLDFQFIVYVIDDEESAAVAEGLGITGTPDVFVDKGVFRYSGSSGKENDMAQIRSYIENASEIETAPINMEFMDIEADPHISIHLPLEYQDDFTGMLTIYKLEPYSNLRNHQGIPIAHRYMGVHTGHQIESLLAGSMENYTMDAPPEGLALLAVVTDNEGNVVNSDYYNPIEEPTVYLKKDSTPLLKITSPGSADFNTTMESFLFSGSTFTHEVSVWTDNLPDGWELDLEGIEIGQSPSNITFSSSSADMETMAVGRIRYFDQLSSVVSIPENTSGTFNFKLMIRSGEFEYSRSVVVMASTPDDVDDTWPPEIEITNFYMIGENKNIYLYVEADNVPENATVKAEVLPCNYEGNQLCGLPKDIVLGKIEEGLYRASINNNVVDLTTYSHLTYKVWIEAGGIEIGSGDEEKTVKISTLADKDDILDDDDEDDKIDPLLVAFSIGALLFALALAVVLFLLTRKSGEDKGEDQEEKPSEDEEMDDAGLDETSQIDGTSVEDGPVEPSATEAEASIEE